MIWKTQKHQFSATVCQRTGKTCPALARMARALTQAVATAGPATTDDFEIDGSTELNHCPEGCSARFRASATLVRVFCGTPHDVDADMLDGYADLMFGTAVSSLPAKLVQSPPCAMLEAIAITPEQTAQPVSHAAL